MGSRTESENRSAGMEEFAGWDWEGDEYVFSPLVLSPIHTDPQVVDEKLTMWQQSKSSVTV